MVERIFCYELCFSTVRTVLYVFDTKIVERGQSIQEISSLRKKRGGGGKWLFSHSQTEKKSITVRAAGAVHTNDDVLFVHPKHKNKESRYTVLYFSQKRSHNCVEQSPGRKTEIVANTTCSSSPRRTQRGSTIGRRTQRRVQKA